MEDVTVVIFYVQQPEWHIFIFFLGLIQILLLYRLSKHPRNFHPTIKMKLILCLQAKKEKKILRIIRDDEIQRKSSSHPDTHSGCSTHSLTFPHSQPHWQITYSFMQTESPSPPAELPTAQGITLSDQLCWAGRRMLYLPPCSQSRHMHYSNFCSLM